MLGASPSAMWTLQGTGRRSLDDQKVPMLMQAESKGLIRAIRRPHPHDGQALSAVGLAHGRSRLFCRSHSSRYGGRNQAALDGVAPFQNATQDEQDNVRNNEKARKERVFDASYSASRAPARQMKDCSSWATRLSPYWRTEPFEMTGIVRPGTASRQFEQKPGPKGQGHEKAAERQQRDDFSGGHFQPSSPRKHMH